MTPKLIVRHDSRRDEHIVLEIDDTEDEGRGNGVTLTLSNGEAWMLFRSRLEAGEAAREFREIMTGAGLAEWAEAAAPHPETIWAEDGAEHPADFWRWSKASIRHIADEIGDWDPKTAVLYRSN